MTATSVRRGHDGNDDNEVEVTRVNKCGVVHTTKYRQQLGPSAVRTNDMSVRCLRVSMDSMGQTLSGVNEDDSTTTEIMCTEYNQGRFPLEWKMRCVSNGAEGANRAARRRPNPESRSM